MQSLRLLADGCRSFRVYAVEGMDADERNIRSHVERSLMLATALVPRLGYDTVSALAHKAHTEGLTLRQALVSMGLSDGPSLEAALDPAALVGHRNRAG